MQTETIEEKENWSLLVTGFLISLVILITFALIEGARIGFRIYK